VSTDPLLVRRDSDAVATLVLNRPDKRNALSVELRDRIADALDALAADETLKVVVVTGAGPVFSAGFDLGEFRTAFDDAAFAERLWASSDRYHATVLRFPLPLVAAVNGPAIAGGFDLALCCDLRVAASNATFSHPEYTFGDVVYSPLHDLVGGAVARELCMTGRELDAAEALALRVVNRVVEPDALPAAVDELTARIAAAPRPNLLRTKAKAIERSRIVAGDTLDL
jgi:enoyl-CoA hydratase